MSNLIGAATLEKKQPIYKIEADCLISKNADVTVAFRLDLPEIFTRSAQDYISLHATVTKALRVLPCHTIVHKQDWFVEDRYHPDFADEASLLQRAYERHFFERPFLNHVCYLFITKTPADRGKWNSLSSLLTRKNIVPRDMLDAKLLTEFFDSVGQFQRLLEDSRIGFTRLTADDLAGTEGRTGLLEKYFSLDLRDNVPMVDLELEKGLKVGSKFCNCYSIANLDDLPLALDVNVKFERLSTQTTNFTVGFASPLGLLLGCNHIYNQYIFIDNHAQTLKTFEKKKDNLNSLSMYSRQNAINKEWYDAYLNEAISQQKLSVRAHCNILVWTEQEAELKEIRNKTSSAIVQMGCQPRENTVDIATLYWAGIPGNAGDFPNEETFYTFEEQACCFWNVETNYRDSLSPFGMKLSDRITGKPVLVDLSDAPMKNGTITNRNKFILGPSGSGKSFFTNGMVRQYYEQGTHVLLIDMGNSYKGLCELVGGVYFTYSEDDPIAFNPFHVEGRPDVEKKESIKTLLQTLWKKDDEVSSRSEYVSITNAVGLYYTMLEADQSQRACFDTFYEFVAGPYARILKEQGVREKDFDVKSFLYVLRPFYKGGEYDYLLNSNQDLDLVDKPFIVFELDNIKDNPILFPVVTLIIMDTFIAKMRKLKGIRKMILIEEAWKAMATAGMADYIKYLFRTVRKFFGEAIIVTQEVDDIVSNPIVKTTILNNSDCKILLDQRKFAHRFDEIQALLSLTDKEKALVLSINLDLRKGTPYREVFISLGGVVSKVYGVEVSAEEYVTYTTEEKEKLHLTSIAAKNGGNLPAAVKTYAAELREGSLAKA